MLLECAPIQLIRRSPTTVLAPFIFPSYFLVHTKLAFGNLLLVTAITIWSDLGRAASIQ